LPISATSGAPDELSLQQSGLVRRTGDFTYRDLNKNGRLDVYEDPRQPLATRVEDLLSQMTLEDKAGLLFFNGAAVNDDGSLAPDPHAPGFGRVAVTQMREQKMNHFNLWAIPPAKTVAVWYNNLQRFAEETSLGIPVTIGSDPRNHFSNNIFAFRASGFSQWCETLGFAAIGDAELVRRFAAIVREEYLAVGIRVALHPQIDLATEPRWPRISGTFGEDADLTANLVRAYIAGFQGDELGPHSVACMTKHFPGGGPQKDGLDPHFEFQQGQIYPGNNFDYHLIPFAAAIAQGTAAMMPYYGIPVDQTDENVAMAFNKTIITKLLREQYGYDGVVCTDWGLITDNHIGDVVWPARAWGVEHLSEAERLLKALEAGVDQFGGESCANLVVDLVRTGRLAAGRLDESVRRLLRLKFQLGLFDNPFVDEARVPLVLGRPESVAAGAESQRQAMTLLKNDSGLLPLSGKPKLFLKNVDAATAAQYAEVVAAPEDAELAVLRLATPWVPVATNNPFARGFHHGDLDFKDETKAEILALLAAVPTIVVLYLDRPAVIPEISHMAKALLADYGAEDAAVLDVIFGRAAPRGRLPFELPRSMETVRTQKADVPYDSADPLYAFGFGLSY
jgi:beta-glucosidase